MTSPLTAICFALPFLLAGAAVIAVAIGHAIRVARDRFRRTSVQPSLGVSSPTDGRA